MLVAVQQRTREIGIEKALGAQRHHILIQFLAEALAITVVGGAAGIVLAYLVSALVGRITFYSALASNAESADIRLDYFAHVGRRGHSDPDHHGAGQWHDPSDPRPRTSIPSRR